MIDQPCLMSNAIEPMLSIPDNLENHIAFKTTVIEAWFQQQWQLTPPPLTSSVDLRYSGFKLAPVDTNLFPAGFNNLDSSFIPGCIEAVAQALAHLKPRIKTILILPENHTRNHFYNESLFKLVDIVSQAGFNVRVGSLDESMTTPKTVVLKTNSSFLIEPLIRENNRIGLVDFDPDLIILNNDLSTGFPAILQQIDQPIHPTAKLGWSTRLKSTHFGCYRALAQTLAQLIGIDPWLINADFKAIDNIDFMTQTGLSSLANEVELMLATIESKYRDYQINQRPFVIVKADNGTYGMGVMMIDDADKLRQLNRKQRTKMAASKGSQQVSKVIIQEGVYSQETVATAVAEPVAYMIGPTVVGGFYRVHPEKHANENLNAPGMYFEPLCFNGRANNNFSKQSPRFYAYSVIARLAALAAAREIAAVGVSS